MVCGISIDKIPHVGRKGTAGGSGFPLLGADKVCCRQEDEGLAFRRRLVAPSTRSWSTPFGTGTAQRPWYGKYSNPEDEALAKVDYAFEFFQKLGVEYSASMIAISLRKAIPCARPTRTWTRSSTRSREHGVHRHQAAVEHLPCSPTPRFSRRLHLPRSPTSTPPAASWALPGDRAKRLGGASLKATKMERR